MPSISVDRWSAVAPGLVSRVDWERWLQQPCALPAEAPVSLNNLPPMMRRRLSPLGKLAMAAALPLLESDEPLPLIFASRHGDTPQTLSLLQDLARAEPLSPTAFSLSVHNAISGVFSIARRDISAVTALAAVDNIVLSMLFEAVGQLQDAPRVLCILCEAPLPELYRSSALPGPEFPYALAMSLSRNSETSFSLENTRERCSSSADQDAFELIRLLLGLRTELTFGSEGGQWCLKRQERSSVSLS